MVVGRVVRAAPALTIPELKRVPGRLQVRCDGGLDLRDQLAGRPAWLHPGEQGHRPGHVRGRGRGAGERRVEVRAGSRPDVTGSPCSPGWKPTGRSSWSTSVRHHTGGDAIPRDRRAADDPCRQFPPSVSTQSSSIWRTRPSALERQLGLQPPGRASSLPWRKSDAEQVRFIRGTGSLCGRSSWAAGTAISSTASGGSAECLQDFKDPGQHLSESSDRHNYSGETVAHFHRRQQRRRVDASGRDCRHASARCELRVTVTSRKHYQYSSSTAARVTTPRADLQIGPPGTSSTRAAQRGRRWHFR